MEDQLDAGAPLFASESNDGALEDVDATGRRGKLPLVAIAVGLCLVGGETNESSLSFISAPALASEVRSDVHRPISAIVALDADLNAEEAT